MHQRVETPVSPRLVYQHLRPSAVFEDSIPRFVHWTGDDSGERFTSSEVLRFSRFYRFIVLGLKKGMQ